MEDPIEVAYAPPPHTFNDLGWRAYDGKLLEPKLMDNGWSCFATSELIRKPDIRRTIFLDGSLNQWFAQANHIFGRLGITCDHRDYAFTDCIVYQLSYSAVNVLPEGFLFLCPLEDLQSSNSSSTQFRYPACAAYWSLDSSWSKRLSDDEAQMHRFPSLELTVNAHGQSWDKDVYTALQEFHRAKGFNPESQEVALHLGHSLFQLTTEGEALFSYLKGDSGWDEEYGVKSEKSVQEEQWEADNEEV
ncbi:hypothetical protein C8F04DRAFT_1268755 [Mycena alexandri]|uniref:Uncharacterized protein n=1 Tax=Mycena alexandri TaxID=1745969 RepID=A0AAD6SI36_9AGAR|nr:hypothetical protein C8F04DRAFT_1268755 [Mycena alexandri]